MESNLSSVPPVWPSPRPEIIGTKTPQAARIGASMSETLSPTPPVECLSTTGPFKSDQSSTLPESRMAVVSATRSLKAHVAEKDRHGEGGRLGMADRAIGEAVDEAADFAGGQLRAIALFRDHFLGEEKYHCLKPRRAPRCS